MAEEAFFDSLLIKEKDLGKASLKIDINGKSSSYIMEGEFNNLIFLSGLLLAEISERLGEELSDKIETEDDFSDNVLELIAQGAREILMNTRKEK